MEWDFGELVRGRRGCCGLLPGWRDGRNCCERRGQCGGGDARSGGDSFIHRALSNLLSLLFEFAFLLAKCSPADCW